LDLNSDIFKPEILKILSNIYNEKANEIIHSLSYPTPIYTLRINTLKTDADEVISISEKNGIKLNKYHFGGYKPADIVYYCPSTEKRKIEILEKIITVDKFAGESICQGANLYRPGVKNYKSFEKNEILTVIIAGQKKIPVAHIKANISSKRLSEIDAGLVGTNIYPMYKAISIQDLEAFKLGYIYDQSLPAMITSKILDPKPNELVIDMCAGPGGKTTYLAQIMKNKGSILAIDRSNKKINRIKDNIIRLGVENVTLKRLDSTKLEGYSADKILVDPPCSALGVRPKLFDETTITDINNFSNYQKQFLTAAIENIKSRGIIVYSTCTLTLDENEFNVKFLIKEFGCQLMKQPIFIGSPGFLIDNEIPMNYTQRFSPYKHNCPGFYIAKLKAP
jgi:16S rRNA C967 or C1407 C5-methylase (RsmB/RsmF family)